MWAFDQEEYTKFANNQGGTYEKQYLDQSSFDITFEAPYDDIWYIVFWNYETVTTVQVTFTATHNSETTTNAILTIIIGLAFFGVAMVLNFIPLEKK